MRLVAVVALLLTLTLSLAVPTVPAPSATGGTVGMNLGYVQPGIWDVFEFQKTGGTSDLTITLSWAASTPPADYDLRLYQPGALNDGRLSDNELIAKSERPYWGPDTEWIVRTLPDAVYVIAVVPFQTQFNTYTLNADPGQYVGYARAPGFTATCPFTGCPV